MLKAVATGAVVFDGDAEFGKQDVGPHFEVLEERSGGTDGVVARGDSQTSEEIGTESCLNCGGRLRGAHADERFTDRKIRRLAA
jgi:hypothetical protein